MNCWKPLSQAHHNVDSNVERDGLKSVMDWAISIQAAEESVEGSETNRYSPNVLEDVQDESIMGDELTRVRRRYEEVCEMPIGAAA